MGKKINEDQFLITPGFILFNKELDCTDKMIVADIYSLSQLPKGCYKSQNGFAAIINLDRSTISQRLEELRVNGFITITKIRPELKNSRKKYELIIERFYQEKVVDTPTILVDEIVEEPTTVVHTPTTTSVPVNYQVVDTPTTSSLPTNIYNNNTNTNYNNSILEQENTQSIIESKTISSSGVSITQFARNNISVLEDKILNASANGIEIIKNASYSTLKHLYEYVDNKNEYDQIFPLLKCLLDEKRRLNG